MDNYFMLAIVYLMHIIMTGPLLYFYLRALKRPFIKPPSTTTTIYNNRGISGGADNGLAGKHIMINYGSGRIKTARITESDETTITIFSDKETAIKYSKDHLEPCKPGSFEILPHEAPGGRFPSDAVYENPVDPAFNFNRKPPLPGEIITGLSFGEVGRVVEILPPPGHLQFIDPTINPPRGPENISFEEFTKKTLNAIFVPADIKRGDILFEEFTKKTLNAICSALGVSYKDLMGISRNDERVTIKYVDDRAYYFTLVDGGKK